MSNDVRHAMRGTSGADLLIWWQTLTSDEQDLLRVTHSVIPDDPHMMAFLASTECPLVEAADGDDALYRIDRPDQLHALLSQM
ncbi:MAG: hypothetical protein LH645_06455 [Actinomycetia bacterium]|nr:hypothetical protein [Actinomycetes bacterium]